MPGRLLRPPARRLSQDEALVAAVRAGDEGAFETIFDRYHRALLSFCRHMVGNREEAEDAVQQTFMAAYRDLSSSTKQILLRPWLYTIARNNCLSILRGRRESVPIDDVAPATEGLSAEVQRREELRQMLVDLRRLPDDQRAALVLAELGSLPHQEIADVVGCPREKVKALIFQARSSLAASRTARETPCVEVREQLATLTGGALRRAGLRRHVRECPGCREFEADVRRQRRAMAVLLPVVPTAGFKDCVLGAIGLNAGGGAAAGLAGGGAGSLGAAGVAKLIAVVVVALGAGIGGVTALSDRAVGDSVRRPAPAQSAEPGTAAKSAASRPDESLRSPLVVAAQRRAAKRSASAGAGQVGAGKPGAASPGAGGGPSSSGTPSGDGGGGSGAGGSGAGGSGAGGSGGGKGSGGSSGSGDRGDGGGQTLAPGQAGTSPGLAGTAPGRSGRTPANGSPPPGSAGTSPGQSGNTPGQSGSNPGGGDGGGKGGGNK